MARIADEASSALNETLQHSLESLIVALKDLFEADKQTIDL